MTESSINTPNDDFDSPWKDLLDELFEPFVAFFFPAVHVAINWTREIEFLDKELQKITADAPLGRRFVDKLVKVWLKNGQQTWVLTHVEIQGTYDIDLPFRLFVYYYRIFDRYQAQVATFSVLADPDPNWRPNEYRQALFGTESIFRFSIAKLTDYAGLIDVNHSTNANPFEVIVLAHLKAQETRGNALARFDWKWRITRLLYERGYNREQVIRVFRFIDWVMRLPEDLAIAFDNRLSDYEEVNHMPYITHIEQRGLAIGEQRGLAMGEKRGLERGIIKAKQEMCMRFASHKFGSLPPEVSALIYAISLQQLDALIDALFAMTQLQELTNWLQDPPTAPHAEPDPSSH
ncbi:MAG: DUF4351 domain-containing protein [Anaerolineae bacterium]|nr:DUF4351 domain-containing protein [Anaerolineae bacterium]